MMTGRLILMPCSATKRKDAGLLPASERYDGPLWRSFRSHYGPQTDDLVLVLSGRFGLIRADKPIPDYEEKISAGKVDRLIASGLEGDCRFAAEKESASSVLALIDGSSFSQIINAGAGDYRRYFGWLQRALQDLGIVDAAAPVLTVSGGIGMQRQQLNAHLRQGVVRTNG